MVLNLILTLLTLSLIDNSSQAAIQSRNDTRRFNREEWAGACDAGMTCTLISNCYSETFPETIFPCGAENGGVLFVCCTDTKTTMKPTTSLVTKRPSSSTTRTERTPTTTTRRTSTSTIQNKWSGLPKSLQSKAKLLPEDCGIPGSYKDKIVNGNITDLGEYPWMVLIGYENQDNELNFYCGGTLINNRYVITAAHCRLYINIYEPTIARLGEWDTSTKIDCVEINGQQDCGAPVVDARIERFIVHERFADPDLPSFQNDIALVRLAEKVKFTEFITPICLEPTIHQNYTSNYIIVGWGVWEAYTFMPSALLQHAFIKLYDFDECNSIAPQQYRPLSNTTQFCAGGESQNSCRGDSGGPFSYISKNGRFHLKGVISLATADDCGESGKPNIYTEVVPYMNWILSKMKE